MYIQWITVLHAVDEENYSQAANFLLDESTETV